MKNYFEIIDSINNISSIDKSKLIKKKIKFLCNFNSFQLQAYLEYYLKKKDILSEIIESDFDQIHQQIIKIKKEDKIDVLIVGNEFNLIYENSKLNINKFANHIFEQIELLNKLKNNTELYLLPSVALMTKVVSCKNELFRGQHAFLDELRIFQRACDVGRHLSGVIVNFVFNVA